MGYHSLLWWNLPNPGIELRSPALQADSLPSEPPGKSINIREGRKKGREGRNYYYHRRDQVLLSQKRSVNSWFYLFYLIIPKFMSLNNHLTSLKFSFENWMEKWNYFFNGSITEVYFLTEATDLQYCIIFRYTAKWFSYIYVFSDSFPL